MKKLLFGFLTLILSSTISLVAAVELKPNYPETYIVKKGDTLWDISSMYLTDPWLWPEIWHVNPQVPNPHLIYPGDILTLVYRDGQPVVLRGRPVPTSSSDRLERLEPRARLISEGGAIPTIPLDEIKPFLVGAQVVSEEELDTAPYVLSSDGRRLIMGVGDRIYVRGIATDKSEYSFFRKGQDYRDPESGELLGTEAIHLGNGKVVRRGDPSTITLEEQRQEIIVGDRLIPTNDMHLRSNFMPKPAPNGLNSKIIAVYDGVTQIGQYHTVVLNKGERDGMQVGHVQRVWQTGETIEDKIGERESSGFFDFNLGGEEVKLPDEPAGTMMVFRTFEKVSLAIIMEATKPMHVFDTGRAPNEVP
ncbi:MAG: LysM domain-containing protein [Pseudomonadota bacterium]